MKTKDERQATLFEIEFKMVPVWEMSRLSAREAANILMLLLQGDTPVEQVSFGEIVKHKMGLAGDMVPDSLARDYANQVDAVRQERLKIKEFVEETGDYRLAVIDEHGRSALRGGDPCAFALRGSVAGLLDTAAQWRMVAGNVRKVARDAQLTGLMSQQDQVAITAVIDAVGTKAITAAAE